MTTFKSLRRWFRFETVVPECDHTWTEASTCPRIYRPHPRSWNSAVAAAGWIASRFDAHIGEPSRKRFSGIFVALISSRSFFYLFRTSAYNRISSIISFLHVVTQTQNDATISQNAACLDGATHNAPRPRTINQVAFHTVPRGEDHL